jgi:hypothetical protein
MAFILTLKVPIRMGQRANRSEIFEEVNGKPLIFVGEIHGLSRPKSPLAAL